MRGSGSALHASEGCANCTQIVFDFNAGSGVESGSNIACQDFPNF